MSVAGGGLHFLARRVEVAGRGLLLRRARFLVGDLGFLHPHLPLFGIGLLLLEGHLFGGRLGLVGVAHAGELAEAPDDLVAVGDVHALDDEVDHHHHRLGRLGR